MFYPEKCTAHGKKFTRKKEDESSASKSDTKAYADLKISKTQSLHVNKVR